MGDPHCEDLPDELTDYILSKEFGWTPQEIDAMDELMIRKYITFMNLENEAEQRKSKK